MSDWVRDITFKDFKEWVRDWPKDQVESLFKLALEKTNLEWMGSIEGFSSFDDWIKNSSEDEADYFFSDEICPLIEELEGDDYFGTEGFMKRYG